MHTTPARYRAILLPAVLIAGLRLAGSYVLTGSLDGGTLGARDGARACAILCA